MASRFIVTFIQEQNSGSSFEGERRIIAESASEAETIFNNENSGGKYFSIRIRYVMQDYNPLTPDEERGYYDKKRGSRMSVSAFKRWKKRGVSVFRMKRISTITIAL